MSSLQLSKKSNQQRSVIAFSAFTILLLTALLLFLQYSYGIGTTTYSLGKYIWSNWLESEDMGHGMLVVPAALFMIYHDRRRLLSISPKAGWVGLPVLIFGFLLYWGGHQADVTFLGLFSIMIVLTGAVWWLLGWEFLQALSFPIAFLLFAIPFPGLDMMVALPLRFLMSKCSVILLNLMGVPVILSGTGILSAPDPVMNLATGQRFAVDVANPCSGIRSLMALMMVGALYARFTMKGRFRKWVLFLCTPPLAVAGNMVRILMLTVGTVAFGSEFALGKNPLTDPSWFHMAAGYLVFIVALGGMMGIGALLERISGGNSLFNPEEKSSILSGKKTSPGSDPY
jgi:exosortase